MSEEHKRVRGEERMTIIDAMRDPQLFGSWFRGKSWESWRVFLKALFGLDLAGRELDTFRQFTGRKITPEETTEAWLIVGRRGGKSLIAALVAVFLGCFRDYSKYLAPGERGTLMVIAADRRSLRDIKMRFRRHVLPFFEGRKAASITPVDIQEFILHRKKGDEEKEIKAASNAEINRELAAIKRAFSLGLQNRKVMQRPYIPTLKERNVRTGFFEREPFESVRKNMPEVLRGLVTFFYITGWRFSEVLSLKWHQVDLKVGRVYLEAGTTKNEDARVFPFTDELREVLEAQRKHTEKIQKGQGQICPWVFHREGKQVKSFRRSWLTACKKAGVPGRIPHDFRRTAVRNLVRAGVPEQVAMKMTGHKTRSVFERYNIVNDADLEEAARRLNDATGKDMGKDSPSRQNTLTVNS